MKIKGRVWWAALRHGSLSFSQEGEDLVLRRIFAGRGPGTYVEVGAHHPHRFSNTFLFYGEGWKGVVIDALPGSRALFARSRPRDIAIECAVSGQSGTLRYHRFDEAALNTVDEEVARQRRELSHRYLGATEVPCRRLADILDEALPGAGIQDPSFLSVDVEGHDLEVLRSNDWARYRPMAVVAECLGTSLAGALQDPIAGLLGEKGYRAYAKTGNSVIFLRD